MEKRATIIPKGDPSHLDLVVQGNTDFALGLYAKLGVGQGNLFFSPYSLSTALAMTYGGARGDTAMQMARALRFYLESDLTHPVMALLDRGLKAIQRSHAVLLTVANAQVHRNGRCVW